MLFSPDARYLALGFESEAEILLYEVESGEVAERIQSGFTQVVRLRFSPSGAELAAV